MIAAKKPVGNAPQFIKNLKAAESVEGLSVRFECRVDAKPEPEIEWFKDGELLMKGKKYRPLFDGELCKLMITELTLKDQGKYTCSARNALGSSSTSAELIITPETVMPSIKSRMKGTEAVEGEEARFKIRVSGNPEPTVQWFKGNLRIKEQPGEYKFLRDRDEYTLVIYHVKLGDMGAYKAVAINDAGKAQCTARLDVKEKQLAPAIADDYEDEPVAFKEGGDIKLHITARGNPRPDVEWYKDGRRLWSSYRLSMTNRDEKYSLVITNSTKEDSGEYKCVAKSRMGSFEKVFVIDITGSVVVLNDSSKPL